MFSFEGIVQFLLALPELRHYLVENNYEFSFTLYCDDIEVVNPIGKHRKVHKLTIFYIQPLFIPENLRSKLSSIFPIAVAPQKCITANPESGYALILDDLIQNCQKLSDDLKIVSDEGVSMMVKLGRVFFMGD